MASRVKAYATLAGSSFLLVGLVSAQTRILAQGDMLSVAVGSFLLQTCWFFNARRSARTDLPFAWLAYAVGGMLGAVSGLMLTR